MASDKPSREQQSPEMIAFHSQYSALADTLSGNQSVILPFATHLYTNDIIDKTVHQNVQDSRNPPYERAVTILSAIESVKMKLLPEKTFRAVVLALRKIDLSMTANKLIEALEASGGTVPPDLAPQLPPNESRTSLPGQY
uniref:Uncharacterized protein n=2 Tax=Amphimedon queenslandica TaxID=400682 RepID=A0A1X7SDD2_AMPQE